MQRKGWTLLFHECLIEQISRLTAAVDRARKSNPEGFEANADVKLFRALSRLMLETIPDNPACDEYRQGSTLGASFRHWRRAKIGRRFRLFFRYDSKAGVIVYAWVNDKQTLRSAGSRNDAYAVFERMLVRGCPPDSWDALIAQSIPGANLSSG